MFIFVMVCTHYMLNVVTNGINVPDAILIRAVEPIIGIDKMLERTGKKKFENTLTKGPGNVAKALGINKSFSGLLVGANKINIYADEIVITESQIGNSKRIGVVGAAEDAFLTYRFYLKANKFVSGRPVK